ncbi:MAG: protease inhibitor I42 family protein [bacterium]
MKYFMLLPLLFLISCASSGIMVLSDQNNNSEVTLSSGERIKIELTSNPSTGYQWILSSVDEDVLQQIGESDFEQETGLLGAPQRQIFMFKTINSGSTNLILYYLRPWESEQSPQDTFQVKFIVR